nr:reverse transcriptase domain-containing protein [Tanacetum cinerariifolium]
MLKVSPHKGVIRFGKQGKLNPRYIGPFKILERIGSVAYIIELPEELSNVHNTFYISNLKKCLSNESLVIPMKELRLDDKLSFVEEPVEIMDRVEVTNRGLKRILERTVDENRALWSDKLEDALWTFRTAFNTPIGCTPYRLVYGKSCHLPLELKHKAFWALKHVNFDLKTTGDHWKLQLNELSELRDQAYENSLIYNKRTKKLHDAKIKSRIFNVGDQVLLSNSPLKIFSRKLKSRWSGPFTISEVYPYGTAKLVHLDGSNFKVNYHRLKHYHGGDTPPLEISDFQTFLYSFLNFVDEIIIPFLFSSSKLVPFFDSILQISTSLGKRPGYVRAVLTMAMNVRNESRLSMSRNRATFKTYDNDYSHDLPSVDPLIDHHCCYDCGNSLNDFFCHQYTCEFCGNGAHVGYSFPTQVPSFQTLPSFPQQYPRCGDCRLIEQMSSLTSMCEMACQIIQEKQEEKRIKEEQAANARYWKIPGCCDDDDDYNSAITPNEPVDSLSMEDEHLDTIPATKSNEVIKSSVEDLVPIPSESEGIPDTMCDVHLVNNPTPLKAKDHFNIVINYNDDYSSNDDDSLYNENIEYIEASPHDYKLVSLEIKALKDNPTPSSEFLTKSSSTSLKSFLEETNTFDNSLPEFENFCFDLEEISSGSTTTHFDISLPDYEAFYFYDDHIEEISSGSTTTHSDISLSEYCGVLLEADHCQLPQYTVNHHIFNAHNDFLNSQNKLVEQMSSLTSMCEMACQIVQEMQEEKWIEEEQAANARYWKIPGCCDDDDDYNSAITPNEPVDSLSMGDEHLDTILATESDEVIKSSVEDLVPILSESEGIPDTMCDVHLVNNLTPLKAKDHFEIVINSNDDYSSNDDDSLYNENIEYVEASPHDSELVSLEVAEIVIPKDEEIEDDNLHEKLLNVHLLIAKIEALKDNLTPFSGIMR